MEILGVSLVVVHAKITLAPSAVTHNALLPDDEQLPIQWGTICRQWHPQFRSVQSLNMSPHSKINVERVEEI